MQDTREVYLVVWAGWNVEHRGVPGIVGNYHSREDALAAAHAAAQSWPLGRVTAFREDGSLLCEYSYGQDPWLASDGRPVPVGDGTRIMLLPEDEPLDAERAQVRVIPHRDTRASPRTRPKSRIGS
jgi:hypothetical protein